MTADQETADLLWFPTHAFAGRAELLPNDVFGLGVAGAPEPSRHQDQEVMEQIAVRSDEGLLSPRSIVRNDRGRFVSRFLAALKLTSHDIFRPPMGAQTIRIDPAETYFRIMDHDIISKPQGILPSIRLILQHNC